MAQLFAYVTHKNGVADETAGELVAAAKKIDASASITAIVTGWGAELDAVCTALSASYSEIWKIANETLAYPNAELVRRALEKILPHDGILLVPHAHFGVDLSPGLSIKMNAAFVSDVVGIEGLAGTNLKLVRQEFGGQISAHVRCDISSGAVINLRPGAFKPLESASVAGRVLDKSSQVGALTAHRRFLETVVAESGDVDISKQPVLVSIGRGIQEQANLAIAQEPAESSSTPVVDAKWMPKSRQVGSSGQTVKPKVYLACGISGAFQHLVGIKGNPFIVAINKNPKAPIFQVADVGIVADLLEFLPELTSKIREVSTVSA